MIKMYIRPISLLCWLHRSTSENFTTYSVEKIITQDNWIKSNLLTFHKNAAYYGHNFVSTVFERQRDMF